mgnify:CR=1 FL=1
MSGKSGNKDKNAVLTEWVNEFTGDMISWAYYKTSDKGIAEDIVQETFLAASRAFDKFEKKSSTKTWLFSILRNKIYDHHRSKFKNKEFNESKISSAEEDSFLDQFFDENNEWKIPSRPVNWDEDENLLDDTEFLAILEYCMEELPEKWFSCIHLKYLKEIDGKKICQDLEISPSNFWQILHRAKLKLRECLEKKWFKA